MYKVEAVEGKCESGAATALPPEAGEYMRGPEAWGWTLSRAPGDSNSECPPWGSDLRVQTVGSISSNETMKIKVCISVA